MSKCPLWPASPIWTPIFWRPRRGETTIMSIAVHDLFIPGGQAHTARTLLAGKHSSDRRMDGLGQATDCCLRRLKGFFCPEAGGRLLLPKRPLPAEAQLSELGLCHRQRYIGQQVSMCLCHSEYGLLYPLLASRSCRWVLRLCWAGRIFLGRHTNTDLPFSWKTFSLSPQEAHSDLKVGQRW